MLYIYNTRQVTCHFAPLRLKQARNTADLSYFAESVSLRSGVHRWDGLARDSSTSPHAAYTNGKYAEVSLVMPKDNVATASCSRL